MGAFRNSRPKTPIKRGGSWFLCCYLSNLTVIKLYSDIILKDVIKVYLSDYNISFVVTILSKSEYVIKNR